MRRFKTAVKQNNNFFYLIHSNGRNMQGLNIGTNNLDIDRISSFINLSHHQRCYRRLDYQYGSEIINEKMKVTLKRFVN